MNPGSWSILSDKKMIYFTHQLVLAEDNSSRDDNNARSRHARHYVPFSAKKEFGMKLQICLFTLVWALVGCTSSALVTPTGQGGDISFEAMNEKIRDNEITISLDDDTKVIGKGFYIQNDSASWIGVESGRLFKSPVSKIHSLSTSPNRFVGGLIGFGGGLVVGGLAGMVAGNQFASTAEHGTWAALGAAVGGGIGVLVGTPIGIAVAPSKEYYFNKTSPEK